ncbi:MAG: glycosyltransferase [Phycisphaera sp.]|nr:glycosyltransferase [Phycisphaera sp.]
MRLAYFHETPAHFEIDGAVTLESAALVDFMIGVLAASGSESYLLVPRRDDPGPARVEVPEGVEVIGLELPSLPRSITDFFRQLLGIGAYIRSASRIARLFRKSDAAIVTSYSTLNTMIAVLWRLFGTGPLVFIVRGDRIKTVRSSKRPWLRKTLLLTRLKVYRWWMRRLISRRKAWAWFQGEENLRETADAIGSGKDHLLLLNALLDDDLIERTKDREHCLDRQDVIFVGRMVNEKGIHDLLDAVELLNADGVSIRVCMVGTGPDQDTFTERVRSSSAADSFQIIGAVHDREEVIQRIAASGMLVLPSYAEGLPRVSLEAMAVGTPTILSKVGGIPHAFEDGIETTLIDAGDARMLADAVHANLTSDSESQSRLTKAAALKAETMSFKARRDWAIENLMQARTEARR